MPQITKDQLAAAFKLWNKDYRKRTDKYMTDEKLRTEPIKSVSEEQADQLLGYVREVKTKAAE